MRYGKTGRKVTNITFVASIRSENETREKQTKASLEEKKPVKEEGEKHSVIDSLVSLGFSEETANGIYKI